MLSPGTITSFQWISTLKSLIARNLVRLMVVDKCHYVTSVGRHIRPKFYTSIREMIGRLWNKCPMLFCSAPMNKCSIYHTPLILHPQSPYTSAATFPVDMGIDDSSFTPPLIDPLPSKFSTGVVWSNAGRLGIDV